MVERTSGIFLLAMAVVVAGHTVVEPLYHVSTEAQPYSPLWAILDPLMVLAVVLGGVFAWRRKKALDAGGEDAPVTRGYLAANVLFFGFLWVGILLLWGWFNLLNPGFTGAGPEAASVVWMAIDATLPLLMGALGAWLLR